MRKGREFAAACAVAALLMVQADAAAAEERLESKQNSDIIALLKGAERSLTWTDKTSIQEYEQVVQIALDGRRIVIVVEETMTAPTSHYASETELAFDARAVAAEPGSVMPEVPINAPKPGAQAAKPILILRCRGAAPCIEEAFTHHQYPSQSGMRRRSEATFPLPRGKGRAEAAADAVNRLLARLGR